MPTQIRQGDVLLELVEEIPATAKRHKDNYLAHGEQHNHAHEIDCEVLCDEETSTLYVDTNGKLATLSHINTVSRQKADHDAIEVPAGKYKVIIQQQLNPYTKAAERVLD